MVCCFTPLHKVHKLNLTFDINNGRKRRFVLAMYGLHSLFVKLKCLVSLRLSLKIWHHESNK